MTDAVHIFLGDDFPSAASLLETVLELQGERERATVTSPDIRPVLPSFTAPMSMSMPAEGW